MNRSYTYPGGELELFEHARNWKKYFSHFIKPYLKGRVLEVGAGIGSTTVILNNKKVDQWILLEPDQKMHEQLLEKISNNTLPGNCRVIRGTVDSLENDEQFDCIIYIDVLEHIKEDKFELEKASSKLKKGGTLIILAPAFQQLFSPFDKAIGHFRRYNKTSLKDIIPQTLLLQKMLYLDSTGYFASLVNKTLLRQPYPSLRQVKFWDKWLVSVSRLIDPLFFYSFGKTILAIWKKP